MKILLLFCVIMMSLDTISMAQSVVPDTLGNDIPECNFSDKKVGNVYYLTDRNGKVLCDLPFDFLNYYEDHGIGIAEYEGKHYVFSYDGTLLLDKPVKYVSGMCDCFFVVKRDDNKYVIYDYNGNMLMNDIDDIKSMREHFHGICFHDKSNVFLIKKGGKWYCYSADLKLLPGVLKEADEKYEFIDSYMCYIQSSKGLINGRGEIIIPREYENERYTFDNVYTVGAPIKKTKLYKKVASRFQSREEYDNLGFITREAGLKKQLFDMTGRALTPPLSTKQFYKTKDKAAKEYILNYSGKERNSIYRCVYQPYEELGKQKNGSVHPRYCSVHNGKTFYAFLTDMRDNKVREATLAIAKTEKEEKERQAKEQARLAEERARYERERAKQQKQERAYAAKNQSNGTRPRGCYASSGTDIPNPAYDSKVGPNTNCNWVRPPKGSIDSHGWQHFICSFDSQQAIAIKVWFHTGIQKWVADSQVGKYGINNESHVYIGENDKFWVFRNCEMLGVNDKKYSLRPGYDLYIAKDWTLVGLSHEPDVVYDQLVSVRKYSETCINIKVTGLSPQMQINARINAATMAMREQNRADIQRMIDECNQKIDAINRQSVERYTKRQSSSSTSSKVRGIQYAPDYTGGQYLYWCEECKSWGAQHVHYDLK